MAWNTTSSLRRPMQIVQRASRISALARNSNADARHMRASTGDVKEVLEFWFGCEENWDRNSYPPKEYSKRWWGGGVDLDEEIRKRFGTGLLSVDVSCGGDLLRHPWCESGARGCLALIILHDQFSRNMFRGTPQSFAYDRQALALAYNMVQTGDDASLHIFERFFVYMPFEHSENSDDLALGVRLRRKLSADARLDTQTQTYLCKSATALERRKAVIDRFGRYPPRNAVLGRSSTAAEEEYLRNRSH